MVPHLEVKKGSHLVVKTVACLDPDLVGWMGIQMEPQKATPMAPLMAKLRAQHLESQKDLTTLLQKVPAMGSLKALSLARKMPGHWALK